MNANELELILTAKDAASGVIRAVAGVLTGALVGALSDAANAAAQDEANTLKLTQAVQNSGASFEANSAIIAERIKLGQDLAFGDDATRDSLGALVQITGDLNKSLELQGLAMDLARAKGIDLTTASELIGKVAMGNTGMLARYGIVLKEGATAQEALAAMQQKFAGQAEVYGNSTAGSIAKVKDQVSEFKEGIGAALGPAGQYIALLPGLTSGFSLVTGAGAALLPVLGSVFTFITATAIPAAGSLIVALAPILIPIAAIVAAILLLKFAWENNWGDIQGKTKAVMEFVGPIFATIGGFLTTLWEGAQTAARFFVAAFQAMEGPVGTAIAVITAPIRTLISTVQGALSLLGNLKNAAGGVLGGVGNLLGGLGLQLPSFDQGGTVPGALGSPQLVIAHGGERIYTRSQAASNSGGDGGSSSGGGTTIVFNAPVYGIEDFNARVRDAVTTTKRNGGFRGVLA